MTCGYCGFRNSEGERRCRRCGRKPGDGLQGPFTVHRTDGALAAAPRATAAVGVNSQTEASPAAAIPSRKDWSRAIQENLFTPRPASNVIPIESYAGGRVEYRARPPSEPAPTEVSNAPTRRPAPHAPESQTSLEFLPPAPAGPRTLGTAVEAVICCEAPVATTLHRAIAAALDWSMVLIAYGLFLLAFFLAGGAVVLTKTNALLFSGVLPLVAFTYGLFWTVAATETPGQRWAQLRITTFDGYPPEHRQRVLRFVGSCLALCTVIGLLWSLADEESLNWQDHISGTFPTPVASDTQVFHRR